MIGAWRDFNIPDSNRPHITGIYGKQDNSTIKKANKFPSDQQFSLIANAIDIYQVDENGNLYGPPILKNFFKHSS